MMADPNKMKGERRKTIGKKSFQEPLLKFIEPKLKKHGDVTKITFNGGVFAPFSPDSTFNGGLPGAKSSIRLKK